MTPVDDELNELRLEFLNEASVKAKEIGQLLGAPADKKAVERSAYLAHQLKGAGGSYGYNRISVEAAELERALEKSHDGAVSGDVKKRVENLQHEIESGLRELAQT